MARALESTGEIETVVEPTLVHSMAEANAAAKAMRAADAAGVLMVHRTRELQVVSVA